MMRPHWPAPQRKGRTMQGVEEFGSITRRNQPLAPFTHLKIGGPAELLVQPNSREELAAFLRHCFERHVPLRVLGGGCNLLVRDEGVRGAVVRLSEPVFQRVSVDGRRIAA